MTEIFAKNFPGLNKLGYISDADAWLGLTITLHDNKEFESKGESL
jgi:hypothetical protein